MLPAQAKARRYCSTTTVVAFQPFHGPRIMRDRVVTLAASGASMSSKGSSYSKIRRCSTPDAPRLKTVASRGRCELKSTSSEILGESTASKVGMRPSTIPAVAREALPISETCSRMQLACSLHRSYTGQPFFTPRLTIGMLGLSRYAVWKALREALQTPEDYEYWLSARWTEDRQEKETLRPCANAQ